MDPTITPPATPEEPEITDSEEVEEESAEDDSLSRKDISTYTMEVAEDVTVLPAVQMVFDETGKKATGYADLTDAAITYTNNSVDSDGTVNKKADKITFKVTPENGRKLKAVQYITATDEESLTFEKSSSSLLKATGSVSNPNQEFEIGTKVADLSKGKKLVKIVITTVAVEYNVKFETGDSGAQVYLKKPVKNADDAYDFGGSTSSTGNVEYNGTLEFAVKNLWTDGDPDEEIERAKIKVSANKKDAAEDKAFILSAGSFVEETEENPSHLIYVLDPSSVSGLNMTDNDDITVTIDKPAKPQVTVNAIEYDENALAFEGAAAEGEDGYVALAKDTPYDVGSKLGFTVALNDEYKLSEKAVEISYKETVDSKEKAVESVTLVDSKEEGTERSYTYVIDLAEIEKAGTLTVKINTEYNENASTVKTVTFSNEGGHAYIVATTDKTEITESEKSLIGKTIPTLESYPFTVDVEDGYAITGIKVNLTKTFGEGEDAKTKENEEYLIDKNGYPLTEDSDFSYPINEKTDMTILFTGTDEKKAGADEDEPFGEWATRSVNVTVTTALQSAIADTEVTFKSEGNYGTPAYGAYDLEVTEGEGVEKKDPNNLTYTVAKGTPYIEVVAKGAETAPIFVLKNSGEIKSVEQAGNSTYRIPASCLEAGEDANNTIIVKRASKTVEVRYNDTGSIGIDVTDKDVEKVDEDGLLVGHGTEAAITDEEIDFNQKKTETVNADAKIEIKGYLTDKKAAPISSVSYQIGKEGGEQSVALKADGTFAFEVKASDDIIVSVSKSTDAHLVVADSEGEMLEPEDGVYLINYTDTLTASIHNKDGAMELFSTSVKVDGKNAATKAVINKAKNGADIVVDPSERNKELTVTLTTLEGRISKEFTIISDSAFDGVEYGPEIADKKLSLALDTKVVTDVKVTADKATMDHLQATIVTVGKDPDKKKAPVVDDEKTTKLKVDLDRENGKLTVTAYPSKEGKGKENAADIVLYDERDTSRKVIEGSRFTVTTTDSDVLTMGPTVTEGTHTGKTLRLDIKSPEVEEDLVEGALWYDIEVKSTATGLTTDLQKSIKARVDAESYFRPKEEVDKNGGVSLQVIGDDVSAAQVGGFNVSVTLVQTIDDKKPSTSNTIKKKEMTVSMTGLSTQIPYYENTEAGKLKIKNVNTTVFTGNENWQAVATPQFDKNARYVYVNAEMVDIKTGETYDSWNDLEARYNDKTGNVEVRFYDRYDIDRTYYNINADGDYKDVGVKVTAATEKSGYGISGTVKLSVVNGIEWIVPTAQPLVLKQAGKPATFKVDVDLNGSNTEKKYAPKNKKVTYEVVSAGTNPDGSNKAAGPAGVTVDAKSGKVTIDKGFVLEEGKNDTFKVLVKADDYAGNSRCRATNVITITDQALPMGGLVIMKKGTHGWTNATIVTGSQIEVSKITDTTDIARTAEYRAVVLQSNVAADRATYDTTKNNIVVDPKGLNFTPAKGGVYVNPDGYIVVSKLGKATIVATDKNDKKNKKELKGLEFVQKQNTKMLLEIKQYKDSTFDKEGTKYYDTNVSFEGNNTTYFALNVVERDNHGKATPIDLSDVKLTFKKNVKNITPKKDADWKALNSSAFWSVGDRPHYLIAMTGDQATISFKSKSMGDQEYTLTNTSYALNKAPKVAPLDKKMKVVPNTPNSLSYVVTSPVKGESLEGKYVMLSLDSSKKNPEGAGHSFYNYLDRVIPIKDGSLFDFKMYPNVAGNYSLNVSVGSLTDGVFKQEYADAKLSVKVAKAGSVNLKVTGKYTLDPQIASKVDIEYNKKDKEAYFVNTPPAESDKNAPLNYAMNAIINNEENEFRKYFIAEPSRVETVEDDEGNEKKVAYVGTIGLKDDVPVSKLQELVNTKSNDLTGYIRVSNGSKQVDVKITIGYKEVKSLKASSASIISGSNMTLDIQLYNGKTYVPVKNDYEISDANFKKDGLVITREVFNTTTKKVDEKASGGDIRLTGSNVPEGKYTLSLKVTPYYATAKDTAKFTVEVPVTVLSAEKAKNKIVFEKGKNTWTVSNADYVSPEKKEDPAQGKWETTLPYTFKNPLGAEELKINVAPDKNAPYVTFASDVYSAKKNTNQHLTVTIDKELLEASVDGKKLKWGGKVTVKPTFTYGDEKNPSKLPSDTASIVITLPGQPAGSETVKADIEAARKDIQYIIDTTTAYYQQEASELKNPDYAAYNDSIAGKVKDRIITAVKGAVVDVKVTNDKPKGDAFATKYSVIVKDAAKATLFKGDFEVAADSTASAIIGRIETLAGVDNSKGDVTADWSGVTGGTKEMKALYTLSKDTSAAQYATMLKNILAQDKKENNDGSVTLTSNLALSVAIDKVKAPETGKTGDLNVTVTVTDKNFAPRFSNYSASTKIETELDKLETMAKAAERLPDDLMAKEAVQEIVGDAWKTEGVAPIGAKDDITENKAFYNAVVSEIEKKANELLAAGTTGFTGNTALTAKVEDGTLEMNVTGGKVTMMYYKLILSEGDKDTPIEVGSKDANSSNVKVEALETEADLLKEAKKITVIKKCATPEEAETALTDKIKGLSKNPAYDKDKYVKVEITKENFIAPVGTVNGLVVSATVTLDKEENVTDSISNIVVLAGDGDDFTVAGAEDMKKEDLEKKQKEARAAGLVQAALSKEALQKIVDQLIETKASGDVRTISKDDVLKAIAEKIGGDDGKKGILLGTGYELANTTDPTKLYENIVMKSDLKMPANATKGLEIPAFTVNINVKDATKDDKAVGVSVAKMTLNPVPQCQTLAEVEKAIKAVKSIDYIESLKDKDPDKVDADKTAILSAVKTVLTNKAVVDDSYIKLGDISGDITPGSSSSKNLFEIKNLRVKITDEKGTAPDNEKTVEVTGTVGILKKDKSNVATGIRFDSVGDVEIEYNETTGEAKPNPTEGIGTADSPVKLKIADDNTVAIGWTVKTNGTASEETYHNKVDWTLKAVKSDDPTTELDDASKEEIAFDATEKGQLNIPSAAHGDDANHKLLLKATATLKDSSFNGGMVDDDLYIELTFVPAIEKIEVAGTRRIEIDNSGNSQDIVYDAKVTGDHLTDADKEKLTWVLKDADALTGIVTLKDVKDAESGETEKTKQQLNVTDTEKTLTAVTMTVTCMNDADTAEDVDIEIVNNHKEDAKAPEIKLGEVSTITEGVLESTRESVDAEGNSTAVTKLTLTGKSARIPLTVEMDDEVEREWRFDWITNGRPAAYNDSVVIIGSNLVITDAVPEIKDEKKEVDDDGNETWVEDGDGIPRFTLKATTISKPEDGTSALESAEYTFALVVNKTITGVEILKSDVSGTPVNGDDGKTDIPAVKGDTVYLQPNLLGYHINDKADAKMSITYRSKGVSGAKLAKPETDGKPWTLTIPAEATTGYVEVTATKGEGESKVEAKRLIQVKAGSSKPEGEAELTGIKVTKDGGGTLEVTKEDPAGLVLSVALTYKDNATPKQMPTITWTIKNGSNTITDKAKVKIADKDITKNPLTYTLTVPDGSDITDGGKLTITADAGNSITDEIEVTVNKKADTPAPSVP